MTNLELFKEKAAMLLQDSKFLGNECAYSCFALRDHVVNARLPKYVGLSCITITVSNEVGRLGRAFIKKLVADPIGTFGFDLDPTIIEQLNRSYCSAFVHTCCYESPDELASNAEERFTAARTAWLQFVIDYEA